MGEFINLSQSSGRLIFKNWRGEGWRFGVTGATPFNLKSPLARLLNFAQSRRLK